MRCSSIRSSSCHWHNCLLEGRWDDLDIARISMLTCSPSTLKVHKVPLSKRCRPQVPQKRQSRTSLSNYRYQPELQLTLSRILQYAMQGTEKAYVIIQECGSLLDAIISSQAEAGPRTDMVHVSFCRLREERHSKMQS